MIRFLCFAILFFCFPIIHQAQNKPIRFQRLTINDGLSLSSVYCIHQDKKGYMWFGTEDGLNRFDGNRFKVFDRMQAMLIVLVING